MSANKSSWEFMVCGDLRFWLVLTIPFGSINMFVNRTVVVAQLDRALDCGSEGRGFESPLSPFSVFPVFLLVGRGFRVLGILP